ncbi:hypothetical protein Pmani_018448 [Petrolisthes manimaculis]|uniref:PH domain-containing protein n=1 Tax=Petrolisthes manimaculis TaxID=1843537 RepID=A0AAE1PN02_9EUCA|nr:hypothetical protein Pmani_018448 [Petrolisthes manimaculis]
MADPFVQKMMARSQARRAGLEKHGGNVDKENTGVTDATRSRLKHLSDLYVESPKGAAEPLRPSNVEPQSVNTDTPLKKSHGSPSKVTNRSVNQEDMKLPCEPVTTSDIPTSPRKPRLGALARRCQEMKSWEDDYSYHSSTSHGSQVDVEGEVASLPSVHDLSTNLSSSNHDSSAAAESSASSPYHTCTPTSAVSSATFNTPTYFFGEGLTGRLVSQSSGGGSNDSFSRKSQNPSHSIPSPSSSARQCNSPSKLEISRSKTTGHQDDTVASPTKKLAWDRGMLNSLEAQGFTPSNSRTKFSYDYKKREHRASRSFSPEKQATSTAEKCLSSGSPSKVRNISLAEFVRSSSPSKSTAMQDDTTASACKLPTHSSNTSTPPPPPPSSLPPVVVSCVAKSPRSSPSRLLSSPHASPTRLLNRVPSPEAKSCLTKSSCSSPARQLDRVYSPEAKSVKEHKRDLSPSKVGEMRSRWEQHIRDASPERTDRSRSPRKSRATPESPRKLTSLPSREQIRQNSSKDVRSYASASNSASKLTSQQSPIRYQDQSEFSRGQPERRSWRQVSPHKPGPAAEIVKGTAPVPDATPLVEKPFISSVRERAAAFDNAGGSKPEIDPAEMTVQERLAIFSKKQTSALVPKAPFGQSVPVKALQNNDLSGMAGKPALAYSQPVSKPVKRVAPDPSQPFANVHHEQRGSRSPSPERRELQTFVSQKNVFENIKDNWRANELNAKIQGERQKEMELLMNRFKKPNNTAAPEKPAFAQANRFSERSRYPEESESDYRESDDSISESTASEDTLPAMQESLTGPPKPPRLFLDSSAPVLPRSSMHVSPHGRLNSTEIGEVRPSPKKEFVPKVKPGCLFPSLSDIESHSEAPDSQDEDDIKDSSFAESVLTCASFESLGKKIQKSAYSGSNKTLSMIAEATNSHVDVKYMSDSTMDALGAIDDAIDEALTNDPTPPKRHRTQDDTPQSIYKTPKINNMSPGSHEEEQDVSLAHSISMYRKQKPDVTYTPVRQIIRRPDLRSPTPEPDSPSVTVNAKIKVLQAEVAEQQRVIAQASNAVTVVLQHPEHQGTPQHVEAEKLLLLATQRRQTALNEIQRLKSEGALGQQNLNGDDETCMGSISISNISVPLKNEFLQKGMKGEDIYHLMLLVKHREQVISSQLVKTPECVVEGAVTFPNLMALHHLTSDFNITLEVYALCTHHSRHHNIKKEPSRMKLTPLKRLHKNDSRMASPSVQSPGGPYAVRTSNFQLVGFTHLNISTFTRNAWTLEKVPFSSPLDGHLLMRVSCSFEGGITERGFLTMFEDVGGFGAWNRRWCVLSGMHLSYWRYPDDENKKEPTGQLDLRSCTTRRVELVSRDVCARQHTFQLTFVRPAHSKDVTNLVQEVRGSTVIVRVLLSSDSKEERILWSNKLNKSLANIRAWDPDALGPEDYQV